MYRVTIQGSSVYLTEYAAAKEIFKSYVNFVKERSSILEISINIDTENKFCWQYTINSNSVLAEIVELKPDYIPPGFMWWAN